MTIKNLLIDQGGVIVDLDRNRCLDALKSLGMDNPDSLIGLYEQAGPFQALESGAIDTRQFNEIMLPYFPAGVTAEQIDEAFSSFIVGIPRRRLEALRELRKRYRLYILSNTNPIMYEGVLARSFAQEGLTADDYFDGIVLSYKAGACKPASRIFDYAVERYGIVPEESLFLDDGAGNIAAAETLGFHGLLIPEGQEFDEVLEKYLSINQCPE